MKKVVWTALCEIRQGADERGASCKLRDGCLHRFSRASHLPFTKVPFPNLVVAEAGQIRFDSSEILL
jgi:hypothetical protein